MIATGARAAELPIPGLRETGYYTNETIFTLTELPCRLAVIGAGPIGCELAQSFPRFGSEVTLLTDGAEIMPKEDRDAAAIVRQQMEKDGVTIITGAKIHSAAPVNGAKSLSLQSATSRWIWLATRYSSSVGRTPNLEGLGLEAAGMCVTAGAESKSMRACARPILGYLPPAISARIFSSPMPPMPWRASSSPTRCSWRGAR